MNYLYSAKANAFFPFALRASYEASGMWPDDGKEVGEDVFDRFTIVPPDGKMMGADKDGLPAWLDIPPLTKEQVRESAATDRSSRVQDANAFISNRQWPSRLMLGRLSDADKALFNKWLDYIDALNALDLSRAPDISWPSKPD